MKLIVDRGKKALAYKNIEYSYKEVIENIKYYSKRLDVKAGDKIAVSMENRPEFIYSLYSIWDKKNTAVVLDASYTIEQYSYAFRDSKPKFVYCSTKNVETIKSAIESTDEKIGIIVVDDIKIEENFTPENYEITVENVKDVALILYTSGTTGDPKGVMLTFDNLESNFNAIKQIDLVSEKDNMLAILPFHHILPLNITIMMPMYFGVFLVILDELSSENLKANLKNYKISVIVGVPRVWEMLHKGIMSKINSSSITKKIFETCKKINSLAINKRVFKKIGDELGGELRVLVSGGAKLDTEISQNFRTFGLPIIEGYGLTETSPVIAFNKPSKNIIGTVGEVIPDVTVKIADDGEIIVKGRNVMLGYYNKPEETEKAIDKDGWFHTGDLGKFEGTSLVVLGRKKEMIVLSNGKNINPSDIENEIIRHSNLIKEVAVTEYNNHLIAIVYPDFDLIKRQKITNIKETLKWEIIDKYNMEAPKYRKILEIKVVKEELPKTKLGKVRRFMLKDFIEQYDLEKNNMTEKVVEVIEIPENIRYEYESLKNYLEKTYNIAVKPDSHLELDLGLDSLDMVEILAFIERSFSVKIDEESFTNLKNVLDIAKFIKEKGGVYKEEEIEWKTIFNENIDFKLPKPSILMWIAKIILKPLLFVYFRLSITDKKNIIDAPAIYAGNHQSFIDALLVLDAIPFSKLKDTYFLATVVQFNTPIMKFIARNGNIILIDINKNLKDTLQIAAKILKENKNLVIFPEGARTRDGEIAEFKKSFAILSKELDVPVVPFGIKGAYEAYPIGVTIPRPKKIYLNFFEKIVPMDLKVENIVKETKNKIEKWLKD